MRVLVITYYWPPAGGSGVQRWLKFVKYLQDFNIEPVVFTADNANYPKEDISLIAEIPEGIEVLKNKIWEPIDLLFWKKKNEQKKDISNATNSGLLSFIRGNFFIPDPKIFWVNSSVKFLKNYLEKKPVDVIITTGPPHSIHLIGRKLKQNLGVSWMADFRDPWVDLYYNTAFRQLKFAKRKNEKLESSVLKSADCVLTVSNSLQQALLKKTNRVAVITNGFDDEVNNSKPIKLDKKFTISYIGLLPKQSNPKNLFKVLEKICKKNTSFKKDLQLNFVGDISKEVIAEIHQHNLENNSEFIGYVAHEKAILYQKKSQVLLLLIPNVKNSEGILTGKLFEYLTAKRPILAISSSKGDLSEVLNATNTGNLFLYKDEEKLEHEILRLYELYKQDNLKVEAKNIDKFHRKNLTKQLATVLKSINS